MAFKYMTDDGLDKNGFEMTSFKAATALADPDKANDAVRLFKQLTDAEVGFNAQHDMKIKKELTRKDIIDALVKKERIYFVKFRDGSRVGMAVTNPINFENAYVITALVVDKAYRGKGLGKKIMEFIMNEHAGQIPTLTVSAANTHAAKLYKSLGFEVSDYRLFKRS